MDTNGSHAAELEDDGVLTMEIVKAVITAGFSNEKALDLLQTIEIGIWESIEKTVRDMQLEFREHQRLRKRVWRERKRGLSVPGHVLGQMALSLSLDSKKEERKKERANVLGHVPRQYQSKSKIPLPTDFRPGPEHYALCRKLRLPNSFADDKCEAMKFWALGKGEKRVDWSATLSGFISRDAKKAAAAVESRI